MKQKRIHHKLCIFTNHYYKKKIKMLFEYLALTKPIVIIRNVRDSSAMLQWKASDTSLYYNITVFEINSSDRMLLHGSFIDLVLPGKPLKNFAVVNLNPGSLHTAIIYGMSGDNVASPSYAINFTTGKIFVSKEI